jgi:L-asparaginase
LDWGWIMGESQARPRVAVIGTGGTMSSVGRHSLDLVEYSDFGQVLDVDQLLSRVPEAAEAADVVPVPFRSIPGSSLGPGDWLELNDLVHQVVALSPAPDGVVITHGTATLEETAYFLNLTLKAEIPVVVVGAQRPISGLSTDAALNLVNAVRVAASHDARGLGVLVLLNDEIHAARDVTKTSTYRLQTFRSPDLGVLGFADPDGKVAIYRRPVRRHAPDTAFDVRGRRELPRVDIAHSYAGADGTAIRAFVEAGASGIVSAGMLPGTATPAEKEAMAEAVRRGVLVVQSSRASGRVLERAPDRERGVLLADDLNPQKARILAMLALTVTEDRNAIQRLFFEY